MAAPEDSTIDDADSRACRALELPAISACVQQLGTVYPVTTGDAVDIRISGTVEEVARGPWSCEGLGLSFGGANANRAWRFRVSNAAQSLWVGVALPWKPPLVAVGDTVSVHYRNMMRAGFEAPPPAELLVRDEDGALLFWLGEAATTSLLSEPPELGVTDADDACVDAQRCGSSFRRGFELTLGGEHALLAYGANTELAGYTALHAGNDGVLSGNPGCAVDAIYDHVGLAVIRSDLVGGGARDAGVSTAR